MDVPISKEPRWLWDTMNRYRLQICQLYGVSELKTKHSPFTTLLAYVSHINDLAILCSPQKFNDELLQLCSDTPWVEAYIIPEIDVSGQPIDPAFHDQWAASKHVHSHQSKGFGYIVAEAWKLTLPDLYWPSICFKCPPESHTDLVTSFLYFVRLSQHCCWRFTFHGILHHVDW
jgi:hypothetical protein